MKLDKFVREGEGFQYRFEKKLRPNEEVYLKMPPISSNKRGVNDIGWQSDEDVTLYVTLTNDCSKSNVLWTEVKSEHEINKTSTYIRIVSGSLGGRVVIRAILN